MILEIFEKVEKEQQLPIKMFLKKVFIINIFPYLHLFQTLCILQMFPFETVFIKYLHLHWNNW